MNEIMVDGELIKIGSTPALVMACGFKSPAEVGHAAAANSRGVAYMRMDDVAEYFRANVPQR